MRLSPWLLMAPVLVGGVVLIVVAIVTAGSSGTPGGGRATPTPDPRVAGLTPDTTLSIEAGDNFFQPTELAGAAGDVIELKIDNIGAVTHNLRLAGLDNEYETGDDFGGQPLTIGAGEEATVVVKIDEPGAYNFRCDFHPIEQRGTLVLA